MEHYSNTKLRAYLKYEDELAVLGLNGKRLFRVPFYRSLFLLFLDDKKNYCQVFY